MAYAFATANYIDRLKRLSDTFPAAASAAPVPSTGTRDSHPAAGARIKKTRELR